MVSQVKFFQFLQRIIHQSSDTNKLRQHSGLGTSVTQVLLEIRPHSALQGPVKQTLNPLEGSTFKHIASPVRGQNAVDTMLFTASQLAVAGCSINLDAVNSQYSSRSPRVLSDLLPYPWDHSSSYWHESRLSLDYRKCSAPRHLLLGALTPDLNRLEPTWRNMIRVSEIPWLSGHVVQSNIVYPAAGYIAMAIEASAQRSRLDLPAEAIANYKLKHISISMPMLIPDTSEGIETKFILRPLNRNALTNLPTSGMNSASSHSRRTTAWASTAAA